MIDHLYSVRMRSARHGKHVSGAERLVSAGAIDGTVHDLVARAMNKEKGFDTITIQVESLGNSPLRLLSALDVCSLGIQDYLTGRAAALRLLQGAGVGSMAVERAMELIANGASPGGGNMRGAMIMDAQTGERFEPETDRGVRVSRFDWTPEAREDAGRTLSRLGMAHYRTPEALALATKVCNAPGVRAELCWSDDPEYTAGYVASLGMGYVRFSFLKKAGDEKGGRAIFVDRGSFDLKSLLHYLQRQPVLINAVGVCRNCDGGDFENNLLRPVLAE